MGLFALLLAAPSAGAAVDQASSVRFSAFSQRVPQGAIAKAEVRVVPAGVRCTPAVRYANGKLQPGLRAKAAVRGRAVWQWRIPAGVVGPARVTIACGRAGRVSRRMTLAVNSHGPIRVVAEKFGFSQRMNPMIGSTVSFGVVLENQSADRDALDVAVLVNFLDAANRVVQSSNQQIPIVSAGSPFYLGASTSIGTSDVVTRLEVVVRVNSSGPRTAVRAPGLANVRIMVSAWEPGWLALVDGELSNDHPTMLLSTTRLSAVLFDAEGNVVGGTGGSTFTTLSPGSRLFFSAGLGARAIETSRAASVLVSTLPTYRNP